MTTIKTPLTIRYLGNEIIVSDANDHFICNCTAAANPVDIAAYIAQCVNAMQGIEYPEMVMMNIRSVKCQDLDLNQIGKLKTQHAEMLALINKFLSLVGNSTPSDLYDFSIQAKELHNQIKNNQS